MSAPDLATLAAAVIATAEAHEAAVLALRAAVGASLYPIRIVAVALHESASLTRHAAERDRPKGPTVRVVYRRAGRNEGPAGTVEIARTTPKRAASSLGSMFDLDTGIEVNAGGYYSRKRMIHPDDLAAVRAMKPGPNAVSKALDAIAKGATK